VVQRFLYARGKPICRFSVIDWTDGVWRLTSNDSLPAVGPRAYNRNGDTPMRGFFWLVLALLLFVLWVGSYIVYHVAGILIHLLLVLTLISVLIHVFSETRPPPRD